MGWNHETSALVDRLLYLSSGTVFVGIAMIAPQATQAMDKPFHKLLDKLDDRAKERKLRETIIYMKRQGLVSGSYSHGIRATGKGQKRLKNRLIHQIKIDIDYRWDKKWRLLFFDIPEVKRNSRVAFTRTLNSLGFQILQKSIWIHPYECRDEIARICKFYGITQWVTYIETSYIDNEVELRLRFKKTLELS